MKSIIAIMLLAASAFAVAGEPVIIEPTGAKVHVNHSRFADAPVLFMNIGSDNYLDVLDQAERGGFKVVLATLFEPGSWTVPYQFHKRGVPDRLAFNDLDGLVAAIDAFRSKGIVVGWHGFANLLVQDGGQVNFRAPPTDWSEIVYSIPVGYLDCDIDASTQSISIDRDVKTDPDWQHLAEWNKGIAPWGAIFHYSTYAIGSEMVRCTNDKIDGASWSAYRGVEGTVASSHSAGDLVYYVPRKTGFFLKAGSEYQLRSTFSMMAAIDRLGLSFFYADGNRYPNLIDEKYGDAISGDYQRGLRPFVDAAGGLWQASGNDPAMNANVRWLASDDAIRVYELGRYDFEHMLARKRAIISREDTTKPYRFEAGWLPLCFELTADDINAVYLDPVFSGRRMTWQEISATSVRRGWMDKPKPERDALLALIRMHEQRRRSR